MIQYKIFLDINGEQINIGDKVVIAISSGKNIPNLFIGKLEKFYCAKNRSYNIYKMIIGKNSYVFKSNRIMKLKV